MEKNYSNNNTSQKDTLPRKIVIKRIMAFSKSYIVNRTRIQWHTKMGILFGA